jgi:hypothetical protein
MELNEAGRRIFGQHWRLILLHVLLGAGVALAIHSDDVDMYRATTRFVIDAEDPTSQTESAAVGDTAKAIATSPAHVAAALRTLDLDGRDPIEIGTRHIEIRPLGTSGVLQLSVADPNREAATRLADELARGVIATRLQIKRGHLRTVSRRLETRIERLTDRIAELRVAGGTSLPEADLLVQRRSMLETQHMNLLATDALASQPAIVSAATPPDAAESSALMQDLVLGIMLGLILGIGLAGLLETLSPTLIGGETVARELDTPLLGVLSGGPYLALDRAEVRRVATRVRLAARAAGVRNADILGVSEKSDVAGLAALLDAAPDNASPQLAGTDGERLTDLHGGSGAVAGTVAASAPACRIRAYDLVVATYHGNGSVGGIVLVSPARVKKAEVAAVTHLLRVSPAPLLGLITYTAVRPLARRASRLGRPKGARNGH